jgi:hypothetical protein
VAKKHSKDAAENGGDLDFAKPEHYVPEFGQAMTKLKKGEMTQEPVKTQYGYHIIKLEDTREATFPPLADVKPQIEQRLMQQKLARTATRSARRRRRTTSSAGTEQKAPRRPSPGHPAAATAVSWIPARLVTFGRFPVVARLAYDAFFRAPLRRRRVRRAAAAHPTSRSARR